VTDEGTQRVDVNCGIEPLHQLSGEVLDAGRDWHDVIVRYSPAEPILRVASLPWEGFADVPALPLTLRQFGIGVIVRVRGPTSAYADLPQTALVSPSLVTRSGRSPDGPRTELPLKPFC